MLDFINQYHLTAVFNVIVWCYLLFKIIPWAGSDKYRYPLIALCIAQMCLPLTGFIWPHEAQEFSEIVTKTLFRIVAWISIYIIIYEKKKIN